MPETDKIIDFEVVDFEGYIRWMHCGNGVYLVDPSTLDDFKRLYSSGAQLRKAG
jgi:hypothetical protein